MTPNAIKVKVGTHTAEPMRLLRRRPKGHLLPASRGVPKAGDVFYVLDRWGVAICLRCTDVKPTIGPLYFAEKA